MSGSASNLVNVAAGVFDTIAGVAEGSAGVFGEEEATVLSAQIKALGGAVEGLTAAAQDNPYVALAGVAVGMAGEAGYER